MTRREPQIIITLNLTIKNNQPAQPPIHWFSMWTVPKGLIIFIYVYNCVNINRLWAHWLSLSSCII